MGHSPQGRGYNASEQKPDSFVALFTSTKRLAKSFDLKPTRKGVNRRVEQAAGSPWREATEGTEWNFGGGQAEGPPW